MDRIQYESSWMNNPIGNNIDNIRSDFPVLQAVVNDAKLVYLDNAATTHKPLPVIKAVDEYYLHYNSNIHRGTHKLSQLATASYENARSVIAAFINAKHAAEIIFNAGTTAGINMIAGSFVKKFIKPGDSIIISEMEHHANIVPWQLFGEEKGLRLKVIPIDQKGELILDEYERLFDDSVKLVSLAYVSNTLGTVNPVSEIIQMAHTRGIPVLLDAAQAIAHIPIDVQVLDVDFLVFSGHKVYANTGVGVLYGKRYWLDQLPPFYGGGDMIKEVSFSNTTFNDLPFKFEAGTPPIAEAISLGEAFNYLSGLGMADISTYEHGLMDYAMRKLEVIEGLKIIGNSVNRSGAISFVIDGLHNGDIGELLNQQGIAVRTGHHCTQPLMNVLKIPGSVRASFALYNTRTEVDALADGIAIAINILRS